VGIPKLGALCHNFYMTKSDLVEHLTQKTNLTKKKVEAIVNCVFDTMFEALVRGDRIEIRGFGSWYVKEYKSYTGRNPKTGTAVEVPEKKLPFFKVGKELKKKIDTEKEKGPIRG
jgi:integration host factor subunit beta